MTIKCAIRNSDVVRYYTNIRRLDFSLVSFLLLFIILIILILILIFLFFIFIFLRISSTS